MWPLAIVLRIWPHPIALVLFEVIAMVGGMVVVLNWICEFLAHSNRVKSSISIWLLVLSPVALLAFNPWILWSILYPFHFEPIGVLFALLCAHALWKGSNQVWIWAVLCILCGDVVTTYLIAVGFSGVIAGRRWIRRGSVLILGSVLASLAFSALHWNAGSGIGITYINLLGGNGSKSLTHIGVLHFLIWLFEHPFHVLATLWNERLDIYANLMPGGGIGAFMPWSIAMSFLLAVTNGLTNNYVFYEPGFQNSPAYFFVPLGTTMFCALLIGSRSLVKRRIGHLIMVTAVVNAIAWGIVWFPQSSYRWISISSAAAKQLYNTEKMIPEKQEVIASQGVLGIFSGRQYIYTNHPDFHAPLMTKVDWIVIVPRQGIEPQTTASAYLAIEALADMPNVTLVSSHAGVWVFKLVRLSRNEVLDITGYTGDEPISAGSQAGPDGIEIRTGPGKTWYLQSKQQRGYVLAYDYFYRDPGKYEASVTLSNEGPVIVEVWNNSSKKLLARRLLDNSATPRTVELPVEFSKPHTAITFYGSGIWWVSGRPYAGDQLEVRVFSPGESSVHVDSVSFGGHLLPYWKPKSK
jgi:hypothetical protein